MPEHPSTHELAAFLDADPRGSNERSRVARHLLAGCSTCLRLLRALDKEGTLQRPPWGLRHRGWSLSASASGPPFNYDRAFAVAERTLDLFLVDGRPVETPPGVLLAELGLPREFAQTPPPDCANRFAIPFLTKWLTERSHALRYSDPEGMMHWALMARLAASGCFPEAAGNESKLADLRAGAEAQLSSALRILGRVGEAEETMRMAWRYLERGTGDPELRAGIFAKTTSLLMTQNDFRPAIELSLEAARTFSKLGMMHRSASARISGAVATLYSGDPEQASLSLWQVLPEIDPREDKLLLVAVHINLMRSYLDLGRPADARAVYERLQGMRWDVEPLILLRMKWQEGLLLNALQEGVPASRKLARVRGAYIERRLAREAIVVTRDLMKTFEHLGESEKASILREETASWLQRMKFGAETSQFFQELQTPVGG